MSFLHKIFLLAFCSSWKRQPCVVTEDECKAASCKNKYGMEDGNRSFSLMKHLQLQGWNSNCSSSGSLTAKTRFHKKRIQPGLTISKWSYTKRPFCFPCSVFLYGWMNFHNLSFSVITTAGKKHAADFKCTISDPSIFNVWTLTCIKSIIQ